MDYSELPSSMYKPLGESISNWDLKDDYVILNTDKWRVPMPKPPVCINNKPCKICPSYTTGLKGLSVKEWDHSRTITSGTNLNKKWGKDNSKK